MFVAHIQINSMPNLHAKLVRHLFMWSALLAIPVDLVLW
jgi:hypothetical protein